MPLGPSIPFIRQSAVINSLAGSQTDQAPSVASVTSALAAKLSATITSPASGQYLRYSGTEWVNSAIQASDVPTLNQNTTGTAANVTGTVAIANGGTGAATASGALDALGLTAATQAEMEAGTETAARRMSPLRVAQAIAALASGGGSPTYQYLWSADDTRAMTAGSYVDMLTTADLAVGCYELEFDLNHTRTSVSAVYFRFQAVTAALAGAVNDAIGYCLTEAASNNQMTIAATGTWTTSAPSKSSSGASASHCGKILFEITSAGTIKLQMGHNATANLTLKKCSYLKLWKRS